MNQTAKSGQTTLQVAKSSNKEGRSATREKREKERDKSPRQPQPIPQTAKSNALNTSRYQNQKALPTSQFKLDFTDVKVSPPALGVKGAIAKQGSLVVSKPKVANEL